MHGSILLQEIFDIKVRKTNHNEIYNNFNIYGYLILNNWFEFNSILTD